MDLTTQEGRKKLIEQLESKTNQGRKSETFQQAEVYNDRIKEYVIQELRKQFNEQTVIEMPVVSSLNICKRVVNNQSIIYNDAPERSWTELNEDQESVLWNVYHDMKVNKKLGNANRYFKLHKQCLIQIIPIMGKLQMRVLRPYQWDAIPNQNDPEIADAYIISSYDKTDELSENQLNTATGYNSLSAQAQKNYKETLSERAREGQSSKTYVVWTREFNFIMDKEGNVISEIVENPISGTMPFIEVSEEKEFEYWVRQASALSNFSIEFNARMSEVAQISKMQGFSQAYLKGNQDVLVNNIQIGPNYILKVLHDPANGIESEFGFASPNADIAGSISFLEVLLTGFLSSQGVDPKTVSLNGEGQKYTSGLERLLALIEKMSATRNDYDVFQHVESQVFDLIRTWLNVLNGAQELDNQYWLSVPDGSEITVKFAQPQSVETESDKLDLAQRKIDMGVYSPIQYLMDVHELDNREDATKMYLEFQGDQIMQPEAVNGDQESRIIDEPNNTSN